MKYRELVDIYKEKTSFDKKGDASTMAPRSTPRMRDSSSNKEGWI